MTRSRAAARVMPLHDLHPARQEMYAEVVDGLSAPRKTLPCKYFYDERGSQLFDLICGLDEYYPTRTELAILEDHAPEIAGIVGERALVIELGSGTSTKTHLLLRALSRPAGYVPLDISREHLAEAALRIAGEFPELPVFPVCADFNESFDLPPLRVGEREVAERGRLVFFPGSTIGNFDEVERLALLRRMAEVCGPRGGRLLIGIDLVKAVDRLESAYDDAAGVTAAFNRNLLRRINRELDADFDVDRFAHRARFDAHRSRIEMYLVSEAEQVVRIDGRRFHFRPGESICTEHSYKFTVAGFGALAEGAGWSLERAFTDRESLFAILLLATR